MAIKKTKRKAFNFLRSYFDVLNELQNDKDKLSFLMSIINKQFLDEDPKDLNFLVNLCYESQRHSIETSVKGWKTATNNNLLGDPITPSQPPLQGATIPPKQEEEEKVEVKEEDKVKEKKPTAFNFRNSFLELGVDSQVLNDWLDVRKKKKSVNSKTAFQLFIKEVEKSKLTIQEAVEMCAGRSWASYKVEYDKGNEINNQPKERPKAKCDWN